MNEISEEKKAELLASYLEGGVLDPGDLGAIEEEIGAVETIRLLTSPKALDPGFSRRLRDQLVARAETIPMSPEPKVIAFPIWARTLAAAAVVFAIIGIGFVLFRQQQQMLDLKSPLSRMERQERLAQIDTSYREIAKPAFTSANVNLVTVNFSGGLANRIISRQRDKISTTNDRVNRSFIFKGGNDL